MKIAILSCSDFSVLGGAERFTLDLAKATRADIISANYDKNIIKIYDPNSEIKIISLNKIFPPEPLKQLLGIYLFKNLKLNYDFYIVLDDMSLHYIKSNTPHLYYILTPRRAYYDMFDETISNRNIISKIIYTIGLKIFSSYDRYTVQKNVKNVACISNNVNNRIKKVYQRDADVIYPPVHTNKYKYLPNEGYWLSVGRVDKWKRIELQIEAFKNMQDKTLIIVGKIYPQYEDIVRNAPKNITFISNVSEEKLIELYSKCEGFITTAIDEDYGLTPIEAMASGKPVIATKEGGYLETVIDGHTGILVAPDVIEIIKAIRTISVDPKKYINACQTQAHKFDYSLFTEKIQNLCNKIIIQKYK
jgi:glycosyltransferase involved in cell wall biosynthesis